MKGKRLSKAVLRFERATSEKDESVWSPKVFFFGSGTFVQRVSGAEFHLVINRAELHFNFFIP